MDVNFFFFFLGISRQRLLGKQAMLEASLGMMNMFPWLIKLLTLVGRSNHLSEVLLPKVYKSAIVFIV